MPNQTNEQASEVAREKKSLRGDGLISVNVGSCSFQQLLSKESITASDGSFITGKLVIPEYQRPYRWTDLQIQRLWNDYKEYLNSSQRDTCKYYLGSLILHQDTNKNHLNIIDGQQRLTTLALLAYLKTNQLNLELSYDSPVSHQQIAHNLKWLKDNLQTELELFDPSLINLTLVVTQSEDDAYRFFETQNTGGVRLAGPDIIKAHHLRSIEKTSQNEFAIKWESLGDLNSTVLSLLKARYWKQLNGRLVPSHRKKNQTRNTIVTEFGEETGNGQDIAYGRVKRVWLSENAYADHYDQQGYEVRQPLNSGVNSVNYLAYFQQLNRQYLSQKDSLFINKPHLKGFFDFYNQMADLEGCGFLKDLFDSCLLMFISQFGDPSLEIAAKKLFRVVYSPRVSNQKAVKEASIPSFLKEHSVLDWIAQSYLPEMVFELCDDFAFAVDPSNLDKNSVKKRFVLSVLNVLSKSCDAKLDAKELAEHFIESVDESLGVGLTYSESSKYG